MSTPRLARVGPRWRALQLALALGTAGVLSGFLGCTPNDGPVDLVLAPAITTQPASQTVNAGASASFTVAASGTGPLTYQWRKDGIAMPGSTAATLALTAATLGDAGSYTVVVTNQAGTVTSNAATLTVTPVAVAPAITTQPASLTLAVGLPASFTVAATGTAPLTYQWSKNGTPLSGATGATFTVPAVAFADGGAYTVVVANGAGTVTSNAATLTVILGAVAPTITTQPASLTILDGQDASFTVAVSGTSPFTYQWRKDGTALTGATAATYAITGATLASAGSYTVAVSNATGTVLSNAATLTVNPKPPVIVTAPLGQTVLVGTPVTLSVAVTGTAPFTYQWFKNGVAISGATANPYTFTPALPSAAGAYTVTVTNAAASVTSSTAALALTLPAAPAGSVANQTVVDGLPATFTASATGAAPLTYAWKKNGTLIAGATSPTYATPAAVYASDNGALFTAIVTDTYGQVTTLADATLTVTPIAPTVTDPASVTVAEGAPATFSVVGSGSAPLTYQWYRTGVLVSGVNGSTYSIASTLAANDNGKLITVTVTNGAGQVSALSAAATLTVTAVVGLPQIVNQPQTVTVMPPDGNTFSVTATGSGLSYAWKKNGTAISGATGTTYQVVATDLRNVADQFSVTITNANGSVDSQVATLNVVAPSPVYAGDPTFNLPGHIYQALASWNTTLPAHPLGSFREGYDSTTLNPSWTSACFFPVLAKFYNSRPSSYPTDTRIVGATPLTETDYSGSGFSRGHQVGYADLANRYGQPAGNSTMYMTNMCPQTQVLNGGVWVQLADVINGTGAASFSSLYKRVWVYTGPVFAKALVPAIGPRSIPIPSHFYNIIVREDASGTPAVLALLVPHSTVINGGANGLTLGDCWKYVTTVDKIQSLTGVTFFPAPSAPLPANFTSIADVRGWTSVLENGIGKPNVHMIDPGWDSTFALGLPLTTVHTVSGTTGTPVAFVAQATTSGTGLAATIASTTWNFGDSTTATIPVTTHTYTVAGDYPVTFTAVDGAGVSNSISRVITIASNGPTAPTVTGLADQTTNPSATRTVVFSVNDSATLANNIVVKANSSDPTILLDNLVVTNANGSCTLSLVPVGALGMSVVTVTATNDLGLVTTKTFKFTVSTAGAKDLLEPFEIGSKGGYNPPGNVTFASGSWTLTDTMTGTTVGSDRFNGTKCLRTKNSVLGKDITMNFDWLSGAQTVTVLHAAYGTDLTPPAPALPPPPMTWGLWYSTDSGVTWTQSGTDVTTSTITLTPATFTININQPIRFEIRRTDAPVATSFPRICFDDFQIIGY